MTSYIVRAPVPAFPPKPPVNQWSDECNDLLRQLWREGKTCSECAVLINAKHGTKLTRNAIIGRVSRMGLTRRGSANPLGARAHKRFKPAPVIAKDTPKKIVAAITGVRPPVHALIRRAQTALDPLPQADGTLVSILSLEAGMCKFPHSDTRADDFAFCGRPADKGTYCGHHHSICFKPLEEQRRRRVR